MSSIHDVTRQALTSFNAPKLETPDQAKEECKFATPSNVGPSSKRLWITNASGGLSLGEGWKAASSNESGATETLQGLANRAAKLDSPESAGSLHATIRGNLKEHVKIAEKSSNKSIPLLTRLKNFFFGSTDDKPTTAKSSFSASATAETISLNHDLQVKSAAGEDSREASLSVNHRRLATGILPTLTDWAGRTFGVERWTNSFKERQNLLDVQRQIATGVRWNNWGIGKDEKAEFLKKSPIWSDRSTGFCEVKETCTDTPQNRAALQDKFQKLKDSPALKFFTGILTPRHLASLDKAVDLFNKNEKWPLAQLSTTELSDLRDVDLLFEKSGLPPKMNNAELAAACAKLLKTMPALQNDPVFLTQLATAYDVHATELKREGTQMQRDISAVRRTQEESSKPEVAANLDKQEANAADSKDDSNWAREQANSYWARAADIFENPNLDIAPLESKLGGFGIALLLHTEEEMVANIRTGLLAGRTDNEFLKTTGHSSTALAQAIYSGIVSGAGDEVVNLMADLETAKLEAGAKSWIDNQLLQLKGLQGQAWNASSLGNVEVRDPAACRERITQAREEITQLREKAIAWQETVKSEGPKVGISEKFTSAFCNTGAAVELDCNKLLKSLDGLEEGVFSEATLSQIHNLESKIQDQIDACKLDGDGGRSRKEFAEEKRTGVREIHHAIHKGDFKFTEEHFGVARDFYNAAITQFTRQSEVAQVFTDARGAVSSMNVRDMESALRKLILIESEMSDKGAISYDFDIQNEKSREFQSKFLPATTEMRSELEQTLALEREYRLAGKVIGEAVNSVGRNDSFETVAHQLDRDLAFQRTTALKLEGLRERFGATEPATELSFTTQEKVQGKVLEGIFDVNGTDMGDTLKAMARLSEDRFLKPILAEVDKMAEPNGEMTREQALSAIMQDISDNSHVNTSEPIVKLANRLFPPDATAGRDGLNSALQLLDKLLDGEELLQAKQTVFRAHIDAQLERAGENPALKDALGLYAPGEQNLLHAAQRIAPHVLSPDLAGNVGTALQDYAALSISANQSDTRSLDVAGFNVWQLAQALADFQPTPELTNTVAARAALETLMANVLNMPGYSSEKSLPNFRDQLRALFPANTGDNAHITSLNQDIREQLAIAGQAEADIQKQDLLARGLEAQIRPVMKDPGEVLQKIRTDRQYRGVIESYGKMMLGAYTFLGSDPKHAIAGLSDKTRNRAVVTSDKHRAELTPEAQSEKSDRNLAILNEALDSIQNNRHLDDLKYFNPVTLQVDHYTREIDLAKIEVRERLGAIDTMGLAESGLHGVNQAESAEYDLLNTSGFTRKDVEKKFRIEEKNPWQVARNLLSQRNGLTKGVLASEMLGAMDLLEKSKSVSKEARAKIAEANTMKEQVLSDASTFARTSLRRAAILTVWGESQKDFSSFVNDPAMISESLDQLTRLAGDLDDWPEIRTLLKADFEAAASAGQDILQTWEVEAGQMRGDLATAQAAFTSAVTGLTEFLKSEGEEIKRLSAVGEETLRTNAGSLQATTGSIQQSLRFLGVDQPSSVDLARTALRTVLTELAESLPPGASRQQITKLADEAAFPLAGDWKDYSEVARGQIGEAVKSLTGLEDISTGPAALRTAGLELRFESHAAETLEEKTATAAENARADIQHVRALQTRVTNLPVHEFLPRFADSDATWVKTSVKSGRVVGPLASSALLQATAVLGTTGSTSDRTKAVESQLKLHQEVIAGFATLADAPTKENMARIESSLQKIESAGKESMFRGNDTRNSIHNRLTDGRKTFVTQARALLAEVRITLTPESLKRVADYESLLQEQNPLAA